MVHVYLKNLRKSWMTGLVPPLIAAAFVGTVALSFPTMIDVILERLGTMSSPIYKAILGDLGLEDLGLTWQAVLFMYGGGTMNILVLFVALFIPARILSTEIDKNTLDVMLSYPIPRWRYLFEKYGVYITYSLIFPMAIVVFMIGLTWVMDGLYPEGYVYNDIVYHYLPEQPQQFYNLVVNYAFGIFLLLFALGAISLLCATFFLDSNRSLTAAGVLIGGQYMLDGLGGLLDPSGELGIQNFSLFHYFSLGTLIETGMLPLFDIIIVAGVGILALIGALFIFHKREFAI
jgi:ABC-type transport system involved in multi-copper enzyme maturation permease subunit